MIRGLRAVSDFEFEFQMALMNRRLSPAVEVAFLMPSQRYTYLNSTLVKDVAGHGGAIRGLVPPLVERKLRERLRERAPAPAAAAATPKTGARTEAVAKPAAAKPAAAKPAGVATPKRATQPGVRAKPKAARRRGASASRR